MARVRPVLAPVTQGGSSSSRLGGGGNVGRAARMNHGDIQQGWTMRREKGHLNVRPGPPTANRCNANGSVTGLRTRITARAIEDVAESFLPVVVPTRAAPALAIATHGVVDVAALDVTTTKTGGGADIWVVASSAKAEVATVDEVAIREAEIRIDWDGVRVSPCAPALETGQSCAMRWGVKSVEEFCRGVLSDCVPKGGTRD
jgi:hypothetical protein